MTFDQTGISLTFSLIVITLSWYDWYPAWKFVINVYLLGLPWQEVLNPDCCIPLNAIPVQLVHEPVVGDLIEVC